MAAVSVQTTHRVTPPVFTKAMLARWEAMPKKGDTFKLGLYWVEVESYSPKSRNVRYRRITRKGAPLAPRQSMGLKRFQKEAKPA